MLFLDVVLLLQNEKVALTHKLQDANTALQVALEHAEENVAALVAEQRNSPQIIELEAARKAKQQAEAEREVADAARQMAEQTVATLRWELQLQASQLEISPESRAEAAKSAAVAAENRKADSRLKKAEEAIAVLERKLKKQENDLTLKVMTANAQRRQAEDALTILQQQQDASLSAEVRDASRGRHHAEQTVVSLKQKLHRQEMELDLARSSPCITGSPDCRTRAVSGLHSDAALKKQVIYKNLLCDYSLVENGLFAGVARHHACGSHCQSRGRSVLQYALCKG